MPPRILPLDGGLVTARSPAMLGEGDLVSASGVEYLPGAAGPRKVEGFEAFETSGNIHGPAIAYLRYNSGEEYVMRSGFLSSALGIYVSIERIPLAGGADISNTAPDNIYKVVEQIDVLNFNNEYFMLFGGNTTRASDVRNFVLTSDSSNGRFHGMRPNTDAPTVNPGTGTGTGFTVSTAGNSIDYWVEERVKDASGTILRRNVPGASATARLVCNTGITYKPVITRPATVNSDATHWAVFATAPGSVYPSGFQIAEVAIAETTIEDTRSGVNPGAPAGTAFGVLTAIVNGTALTVPKYGTAPLATVGDEFESSLVCDDVDLPGYLRYSLAGDWDHFPSFNAIRVGRREGETITMIKRLGQALMVGTTVGLYRVSTLLRPDEAGFQLERTVTPIEEEFGVVNQKSATRFRAPDGLLLEYLTGGGVRVTDGVNSELWSRNLDWPNTVAREQLASAFIVNNPEKFRLELYYAQTGTPGRSYTSAGKTAGFAGVPTHALYFHYDRSHIRRDGQPKITGPHAIPATAGCVVREGTRRRVYLNTVFETTLNTRVVKADGGTQWIINNTNTTIDLDVKTGDIYAAGVGGEAVLDTVYLHHGAGSPTQTVTLSRVARAEGRDDHEAGYDVEVERAGLSSASALAYGAAESFTFRVTNSDTLGEFDLDFIAADFRPALATGQTSKVSQ